MDNSKLSIHSPEEQAKMDGERKRRMVPIPHEELAEVKLMSKPDRRKWLEKRKRARKATRKSKRRNR